MYQIHLGSVLLHEPDRKYIDKKYEYSEWDIQLNDIKEEDSIMVVKKTFLFKSDKMKIWLDIFSPIYPEYIIEDAKRIAYDLKFEGSIKNCSPSLLAMGCLYLSCMFHRFDFDSKIKELINAKKEGLLTFGLRRRRYADIGKTPYTVKKYAKIIMGNMPDKFKNLEYMHKKLEGINV